MRVVRRCESRGGVERKGRSVPAIRSFPRAIGSSAVSASEHGAVCQRDGCRPPSRNLGHLVMSSCVHRNAAPERDEMSNANCGAGRTRTSDRRIMSCGARVAPSGLVPSCAPLSRPGASPRAVRVVLCCPVPVPFGCTAGSTRGSPESRPGRS